MKRLASKMAIAVLLATVLVSPVFGAAVDGGAPQGSTVALTHVTVVDPSTDPRPDVTVLIRDGRIVAIGPGRELSVPSGVMIHDESGRFVIPGLWDAHVHLSQAGATAFPLFLANGVTSVRDMGSDLGQIRRWQRARAEGQLIPRIVAPGPKIDERSPADGWLGTIAQAVAQMVNTDTRLVGSSVEARRIVDELKSKGVDFIKVHNIRSRAVYEAIAEESRRQGLPFAGHLPDEPGALGAAALGQRTIEHGRGMLPCSAETRARIRSDPNSARLNRYCAPEAVQAEILPALRRAGTWYAPTLVSFRGQRMVGAPSLADWLAKLHGIEQATPSLKRHWEKMAGPAPDALERELISGFGPLALAANRAGVPLLAGSDLGDPYVVPGFGLQDELQLLVEAGVSTRDALRSATVEPARAFGLSADLGSVQPGKIADLVVLDADPLSDIRNTRHIQAVIIGGRWLDAGGLARLSAPP
jgi:imidazolonepropionase-like amidohydrolase